MAKIKGFVRAIGRPNSAGYVSINVAQSQSDKDGTWLGTGEKAATYKGTELKKGMIVEVEYTERGDFKNMSGLKVLPKSGGGGGGKGGYSGGGGSYQKDDAGIATGHAANGAMEAIRFAKFATKEQCLIVHTVTAKLQEELKATHKPVSVGHAVLNACKIIGANPKQKFDEKTLEKITRDFLKKVSDPLLAAIKEVLNPPKEEEPEQEDDDDDGFGGDDEGEETENDDGFEPDEDIPF